MESQPQILSRRLFVAGVAAGTAGLLVERMPGAWAAPARAEDDPFTLGVASGDPTPTGVVLWTRLAPRPLEPDGGMPGRAVPVQWEVATGPRQGGVVRRGEALAHPRFAHSVHVEVEGLEPGRTYWYRFRSGGHLSRVGRTRTCPDPGRPRAFVRRRTAAYRAAWEHLPLPAQHRHPRPVVRRPAGHARRGAAGRADAHPASFVIEDGRPGAQRARRRS
jgi:phosphodiesterase/alkaline phosphatase D-like protein